MPHSAEPIHHIRRVRAKKKLTTFDRVIIIVSVAYPLSSIPQLIDVLAGSTSGVSVVSWSIFLVCALLFFLYGVIHRVTPMIVANGLWVVLDLAIVVGLLLQG